MSNEHHKLCRVLWLIVKKRHERYKEIKSYLNYLADCEEVKYGTNRH